MRRRTTERRRSFLFTAIAATHSAARRRARQRTETYGERLTRPRSKRELCDHQATVDYRPQVACGTCDYCRRGAENLCENAKFTGNTLDGGYAQYAVADARFCLKIPERYSESEAAPLLCAGLISHPAYKAAGAGENGWERQRICLPSSPGEKVVVSTRSHDPEIWTYRDLHANLARSGPAGPTRCPERFWMRPSSLHRWALGSHSAPSDAKARPCRMRVPPHERHTGLPLRIALG